MSSNPSPGIVWRGDDLLYLWQMESEPERIMRLDDKLVSQNMTNIWTSFAKLGFVKKFT